MVQTKVLLTVERVTDDSTGIWCIDELEYGVPIVTRDWLDARDGRREALARWLRMLADACEARRAPFGDGLKGQVLTDEALGEKP